MQDPAAPLYELAFEEAGRALEVQERGVNELRSRASVLIASAAIVTSLVGVARRGGGGMTSLTWATVAALSVVALCVLVVLWPPRDDGELALKPAKIVAAAATEPAPTLADVHRELAIHQSAAHERNGRRLRRMSSAVRVGLAMLVVEIVAALAALAQDN